MSMNPSVSLSKTHRGLISRTLRFLLLNFSNASQYIKPHSSRSFSKAMQSLSPSFFFAKPFLASPRSYPRVRSQLTDQQSILATDPKSMAAKWAQKTVVLPPQRRGCHLVTSKVNLRSGWGVWVGVRFGFGFGHDVLCLGCMGWPPTRPNRSNCISTTGFPQQLLDIVKILKDIEQDLSGFKCGLAHFFLQHTSASLTINENYDSDVRDDTETFLNRIVPEGRSAPWKHTIEGPDDMPAHIKSSMFGITLTIPITDGRLNMGTWQGIWLCEHRDHATPRKIVVTLNGM